MTKTFKEVIAGIRTAVYGREVREYIAQMGEYVEQCAASLVEKVTEAATSASNAATSASAAKASQTAAANSASTAAAKASAAFGSAAEAETSASAASKSAADAEEAAKKAGAMVSTDTTLTVSGAAADSKAVGDELKNRYTKSEVDEKIGSSSVETDTTLSISGAAADAKATGTALSGKAPSSHTHTTAQISDFPAIPTVPTSLKNPYSLTLKTNGTTQATYDGSESKSVNITAALIGALASGSSAYISDVSVSSNTLYVTRGDQTYFTVGLASGAEIVAKEIGETNSYIRLSNGIQICWGFASYKYVTFLAPFVDDNSVGFASHLNSSNTTRLVSSTKSTLSANFLDWVAVGLWK